MKDFIKNKINKFNKVNLDFRKISKLNKYFSHIKLEEKIHRVANKYFQYFIRNWKYSQDQLEKSFQVNENKVDKQEAKSKRKSCKFSLNQNVIVYYPNLIPKFYNGTIKAINDETVVVAYNLTHQVLFNQNMIHVCLFGNKELKGYMLLLLLCFFD